LLNIWNDKALIPKLLREIVILFRYGFDDWLYKRQFEKYMDFFFNADDMDFAMIGYLCFDDSMNI